MSDSDKPAALPDRGGSYIRERDGSLRRVEWTEHPADGPQSPEPAQPLGPEQPGSVVLNDEEPR
jgi:hypothetical protein